MWRCSCRLVDLHCLVSQLPLSSSLSLVARGYVIVASTWGRKRKTGRGLKGSVFGNLLVLKSWRLHRQSAAQLLLASRCSNHSPSSLGRSVMWKLESPCAGPSSPLPRASGIVHYSLHFHFFSQCSSSSFRLCQLLLIWLLQSFGLVFAA